MGAVEDVVVDVPSWRTITVTETDGPVVTVPSGEGGRGAGGVAVRVIPGGAGAVSVGVTPGGPAAAWTASDPVSDAGSRQ